MCFSTMVLKRPASGSSVETIRSTSAGVRGLSSSCRIKSMCACGSPLHGKTGGQSAKVLDGSQQQFWEYTPLLVFHDPDVSNDPAEHLFLL